MGNEVTPRPKTSYPPPKLLRVTSESLNATSGTTKVFTLQLEVRKELDLKLSMVYA